jgi:hypothetical protein
LIFLYPLVVLGEFADPGVGGVKADGQGVVAGASGGGRRAAGMDRIRGLVSGGCR